MVGITGDLPELFDKFPTPGDNFMLQISYLSPFNTMSEYLHLGSIVQCL